MGIIHWIIDCIKTFGIFHFILGCINVCACMILFGSICEICELILWDRDITNTDYGILYQLIDRNNWMRDIAYMRNGIVSALIKGAIALIVVIILN